MTENHEAINFFRVLAPRGDAMRHVGALYDSVMGPGELSEVLKEMVFLAVSTVNESDYWIAHREESAARMGLSLDQIQDIKAETGYHFTDQERIALRYARELTRTASVEHETRDALDKYFTPDQRVELTLVIALANFTNRVSNGLKIPIEREKHRTA
jgi:alkylhydroperoxidase family enzyme